MRYIDFYKNSIRGRCIGKEDDEEDDEVVGIFNIITQKNLNTVVHLKEDEAC